MPPRDHPEPPDERDADALSAHEIDAEPALDALGPAAQSCSFVVRRHVDQRLDLYLRSRLKRVSRAKVQQLIDLGAVTVNDQPAKRSVVVRKGDRIALRLPAPAVRTIIPQDIPLEILHEDDDLIVINKQAGLIVHPARSQLDGTLVNALAHHFKKQVQAAGGVWRDWKTSGLRATDLQGMDSADDADALKVDAATTDAAVADADADAIDGDGDVTPILPPPDQTGDEAVLGLSSVGLALMRPGIVHRLDKHTTGVMVVAKSEHAHGRIAIQFERRQVVKAYLAVVHGRVDGVGGVIDQPIGKHPTVREAYAVRHDSTGRASVTLYRVRERYRGFCLVELELKTGRTHQIRVHMSYMGHPLAGDLVYGGQAVGHGDLDHPPTPAGARSYLNYARTREEGLPMQIAADQRSDLLMSYPALHAAFLRFEHPGTRQPVTFTAPVHGDMRKLITELRRRPADGDVAREGCWIDLRLAMGE